MQQTSLGRAVRYLVAVFVVLSALTLLGCSGDGDDGNVAGAPADEFDLNNAQVPVTASTVAIVQGDAFTFPNGAAFDAGIGANPVTLTFGAPTGVTAPFTLSSGASTATGTTTFASCSFTVVTSNFAAGRGPQVGAVITFQTCNLSATAGNVEQGGATVSGTLTLVLTTGANGTGTSAGTANAITVSVSINADGMIVIDSVVTPADVDSGTGVSGATGG